MEDLNVVIAGAAGEGIQTVGAVLAETVSAQGYAVFTWQEYESRIRGGQNSFSIRIGEEPRNAPLAEAEILLPLNQGALEKYQPLLKQEGILLTDKKAKERTIVVPFAKIAEEELDSRPEVVKGLLDKVCQGRVTLVYAAKDKHFNNAVALKDYLNAALPKAK